MIFITIKQTTIFGSQYVCFTFLSEHRGECRKSSRLRPSQNGIEGWSLRETDGCCTPEKWIHFESPKWPRRFGNVWCFDDFPEIKQVMFVFFKVPFGTRNRSFLWGSFQQFYAMSNFRHWWFPRAFDMAGLEFRVSCINHLVVQKHPLNLPSRETDIYTTWGKGKIINSKVP